VLGARLGTDLTELDLTALARGSGVPARRVTRAAEVEAALAEAMARPGPYLLDASVGTTASTLY
jgi:thiamine pyrophosphate-dependent acetolactate synthase large subunit-like protein